MGRKFLVSTTVMLFNYNIDMAKQAVLAFLASGGDNQAIKDNGCTSCLERLAAKSYFLRVISVVNS
jgi:hypothetical protein